MPRGRGSRKGSGYVEGAHRGFSSVAAATRSATPTGRRARCCISVLGERNRVSYRLVSDARPRPAEDLQLTIRRFDFPITPSFAEQVLFVMQDTATHASSKALLEDIGYEGASGNRSNGGFFFEEHEGIGRRFGGRWGCARSLRRARGRLCARRVLRARRVLCAHGHPADKGRRAPDRRRPRHAPRHVASVPLDPSSSLVSTDVAHAHLALHRENTSPRDFSFVSEAPRNARVFRTKRFAKIQPTSREN